MLFHSPVNQWACVQSFMHMTKADLKLICKLIYEFQSKHEQLILEIKAAFIVLLGGFGSDIWYQLFPTYMF